MILKTLYLKIGDLGLPTEFTYGLLKQSRFICNYFEREVLKKMRFRTKNFDRILISLCSKPKEGVFVNTSSVACVDIPFDREVYESKSGEDLSFYLIDKLRIGLDKCAQFVHIPKAEMLEGLEVFVSNGLRNEWIHKQRTFRELGFSASLECQLTQTLFSLRLRIVRSNKIIRSLVILQTDPDEIAFEYRFKDLVIDGTALVVTSKRGDPLWREEISNWMG